MYGFIFGTVTYGGKLGGILNLLPNTLVASVARGVKRAAGIVGILK